MKKSSWSVCRCAGQRRLPGGKAVGSKEVIGVSQVRSSWKDVQSLGGGEAHLRNRKNPVLLEWKFCKWRQEGQR